MPRRILDERLLTKVAIKLGKKKLSQVNVLVSHRASKLGVSPEAALILLAKGLGIGAASFQRRLDSSKQVEVRESLPTLFTTKEVRQQKDKGIKSNRSRISGRATLRAAIEYLIQDQDLKDRCGDILMAKSKFDRPINQATLVLEDRIRTKAQPSRRLVGEQLVGYAFNANLSKTILKISGVEDDQRGFTDILRGIVPAFRNKTHHQLFDAFTREEALRVCGFIDVLLRIVDGAEKVK